MEPNQYQVLFDRYRRDEDPGDNATLRFVSCYRDIQFADFVKLYQEHESLEAIRATILAIGGSIEDLRRATPTMTRYVYGGKNREPRETKPNEPTRTKLISIDPNDMEKTQRELRAIPERCVKHDSDLHQLWKLAKMGVLTLGAKVNEIRNRAVSHRNEYSKATSKKLGKLNRLSNRQLEG